MQKILGCVSASPLKAIPEPSLGLILCNLSILLHMLEFSSDEEFGLLQI
jgi:hypothetical protein